MCEFEDKLNLWHFMEHAIGKVVTEVHVFNFLLLHDHILDCMTCVKIASIFTLVY